MKRLETVSRALVTLGIAFASMSVAVPAWSSGGGPVITWSGTLAASPVDASGTVTINATVKGGSALDLVTSVTIELVDATGAPQATLCTLNTATNTVNVEVHWNTTRDVGTPVSGCNGTVSPGETLAPNGRTRVRLSAVQGVFTADSSTRLVDVWNAPGAPTQAAAAFASSDQAFDIGWDANKEPDISGYVVQQCHRHGGASSTEAAWKHAATTGGSTTTARVPVDLAGTYRFRVAAQRPGPDGSVLQSDWSSTTAPIVLRDDDDDDDGDSGGGLDPRNGDDGSEVDGSPSGGESEDGTTPERDSSKKGLVVAPRSESDHGGGDTGRHGGEASRTVVSTAEGGRGLPPRLVKRSDPADGGYEEALPYGSPAIDAVDRGPFGLLSSEAGPSLATVPLAGGMVALVFGLPMRYLSRRAEALVAAEEAATPPGDLARGSVGFLSAGDTTGTFVEHWRRWLRPESD